MINLGTILNHRSIALVAAALSILVLSGCATVPPSPMTMAIKNNDLQTVKNLVSTGQAEVNSDLAAKFQWNDSPLYQAMFHNRPEIMSYLIEKNANPMLVRKSIHISGVFRFRDYQTGGNFGTGGDYTSIPIFEYVFIASPTGQELNHLKILMKGNVDINYHVDRYKEDDILEVWLVGNDIKLTETTGFGSQTTITLYSVACGSHFTPLICAVLAGNKDMVEYLLSKGAKISIKSNRMDVRTYFSSGVTAYFNRLTSYVNRRQYPRMDALQWATMKASDERARKDFPQGLNNAPAILEMLKASAPK